MDNRIFALGEVPRTLEKAAETVELMAGVVAGLRFDTERMRRRATGGFINAMDLAETIMQETGIPYRSAHRVVGLAIRETLDRDPDAQAIPADVLAAAGREVAGREVVLSARARASLDDPAAVVATRQGLGGAAGAPVRAMIRECEEKLGAAASWRRRTQDRITAAERRLVAQAEASRKPAARRMHH
jgi:argininosuccinate lyase